MRTQDLHILPRFRDGCTYVYAEHCRIERESNSVAMFDDKGKVPVPAAAICVLMLGPGTSITHAAVSALADNGTLVFWCGEEGVRLYAYGLGKTRHSRNLLKHTALWANVDARQRVVRKLYCMRFEDGLDEALTLQQIRGKEGIRVRETYARASRETGVPWTGRSYDRGSWAAADPVNRALSAGNSCLYGICHAGILALGLSPALGFVHTGKMLSFVYDVADLYKTRTSIPVAFHAAAEGDRDVEGRVRRAMRDAFKETRLLVTIVNDLQDLLDLKQAGCSEASADFDAEPGLPGYLWDPVEGTVSGGVNFGDYEPDGGEHGDSDP